MSEPQEPMKALPLRGPKSLWDAFGDAVAKADPESDRAKVLRTFMRWYVGEQGARLPERPDPSTK